MKMVRRGGYREKFGQRLGIYDRELRIRLSKQRSTWLHAVSVGEVNIALKLASALRALEPDLQCVLTTTTTTGFALANQNAPPWIEIMYTPLDYWPIMRQAFSVIRPARIVLVEAEIWPNLAAEAHTRRIPLALVNARLSARSERKYRQFRFFVAPTFRLLDLVCVQEREDADRWKRIGEARTGHGPNDADCVLLDTTGELQRWYDIATVVFMGKSLTAHGGQNPVEPILAGKPVVFGPYMENFATLANTLVSKKGAIQVCDADSLERAVVQLLRDIEARKRLVSHAREVLSAHQGATARAAALIHEVKAND